MLEVSRGLLLGSEGDAMAVLSKAPSVTKQFTVTHILTISNDPLDLSDSRAQLVESVGGGDVEGGGDDCINGEACDGVEGVGCDGSDNVECEPRDAVKVTKQPSKILVKFVQLADMPDSDLLHHFEPCCLFIQQALRTGGTVLVHCVHGISRSVSVVLAYLMWSERRSFQVLYDILKQKKPEIRPNPGFMEQLKLWGAMRCCYDNGNKAYKAYRLKTIARDMKDSGYAERLTMSPDPSLNTIDSTSYYRCRKCRRLLFTDGSVLPHAVGKGDAAFKWHKRSKPGPVPTQTRSPTEKAEDSPDFLQMPLKEEALTPTSVSPVSRNELAKIRAQVAMMMSVGGGIEEYCSSWFIEPVEWMERFLLGTVEGKVLCPKCSARLGSFNWSGDQCSCGQWVTPSFQIHKSRVDETRTLTKRKIKSHERLK